jgi:hypothetical protein
MNLTLTEQRRLRNYLESIAILAVEAQGKINEPVALGDLLLDIEFKLVAAQKLNEKLQAWVAR